MLRWFSRKKSDTGASARDAQAREATPEGGGGASSGGVLDYEYVRSDIVGWICAKSAGRNTEDKIDLSVHMYDAGYVDSMKGADLLVHIEKTYGLFIPETELVGRLAQLDELIKHVVSKASQ
jgi:acyl carrier protein